MRTCPDGHESASEDFCDVCGIRIDAAPVLRAGQAPGAGHPGNASARSSAAGSLPTAPGEPCPRCGTARAGQFCEACGYSFATAVLPVPPSSPDPVPPSLPDPVPPSLPDPVPPSLPDPAAWTAVITADRAYYDRVRAAGGPDAAAISYPESCPERRFPLSGTQVRVGRRSVSRGIEPEIDLTGPPADPGVSRLHALLIPAPDGTWSVVDPGSANGVLVNGAPIAPGEAVPLRDGDRIQLGAWTALSIVRGAPPRP